MGRAPDRLFHRYLGIDYSGAGTPESGQPGIRIYSALAGQEPGEILPENSHSRHWSRAVLAGWLAHILADGVPTLVGLDHGFSFPEAYFRKHGLGAGWREFLRDFVRHWPTAEPGGTVREVRKGLRGAATSRGGETRWRRVCEEACRAKSVFHFDVPGSVASSTHAGLPWLFFLATELPALHFWPFDGWTVTPGKSVLAEAYPSLCSGNYSRGTRTGDQHDAYSLCRWMEEKDRAGELPGLMVPNREFQADPVIGREGWILGVPFPER